MKNCFILILSLMMSFPILAQKHLFLIGVDGMSPDGIDNAKTPHIDALMTTGAYTMKAEAVSPTVSGPNWASLFMGAGPEQHRIYDNNWRPKDFQDSIFCNGKKGQLWPTLFGVIRQQDSDAHLACFHDWSTINQYIERGACQMVADTKGEDHTNEEAIRYIKTHRPKFLFLHLDHVDHAGHRHGHGSAAYYASVEKADELIGDFIEGLKQAGIYEESVLVVTSDHGGIGKGHGGDTPEEKLIPIIINGKGIQKGTEISEKEVMIYDISATILDVLGHQPPKCWIGKSLQSALSK